ncbi:hypothetical protein SUGI_0998390 [Cryptomeria japonica]|nr:hypothetical protein SUGI_0998390 [Cryptomeria japonica]
MANILIIGGQGRAEAGTGAVAGCSVRAADHDQDCRQGFEQNNDAADISREQFRKERWSEEVDRTLPIQELRDRTFNAWKPNDYQKMDYAHNPQWVFESGKWVDKAWNNGHNPQWVFESCKWVDKAWNNKANWSFKSGLGQTHGKWADKASNDKVNWRSPTGQWQKLGQVFSFTRTN